MIASFQKLLAEREPFVNPKLRGDLFKCQELQNIPSENARDYFSLVANLLDDVLEKKSKAVWQRRTEILRTV